MTGVELAHEAAHLAAPRPYWPFQSQQQLWVPRRRLLIVAKIEAGLSWSADSPRKSVAHHSHDFVCRFTVEEPAPHWVLVLPEFCRQGPVNDHGFGAIAMTDVPI